MASKVIFFRFVLGGLLLGIPIVFVVALGGLGCTSASSFTPAGFSSCPSQKDTRMLTEFLPFLMIVGGVLIAYNMKKISDSFLPEKDSTEEDNEEWSTN